MGPSISLLSKDSILSLFSTKIDQDSLVQLFMREDGKPTSTTVITALVASTAILSYLYFKPFPKRQPKGLVGLDTLPSPKRHPLLANIPDFPKDDWSILYKEWPKVYGDVFCLKLPPIHILVLNSLRDVEELLAKRTNVWSARPPNPMVRECMNFGWSLIFMDATEIFHEERKVFRKVLGPQAVPDYDHLIGLAAESFIQSLKGFEGNPEHIVKHAVGSVIMKVAYGDKLHKQYGDEMIRINGDVFERITWTVSQLWLVNFIPWARYLPSWTPGLFFPHYGRKSREVIDQVRMWGFLLVEEDVKKGDADFSVVSKYLSEPTFSEGSLRDGVATMYFAGVDTTTSVLMSFFSLILTHPRVQKNIHEELDRVVGKGVTPSVADIPSLKYLNAAWMETLRLVPPAPTGIPHVNVVDDIWKGVFIPKGTLILPNISFILRDPRLWGDDAEEFKPERFMPEHNPGWDELPDMHSIPFGFGRRICPGRYIAERNGLMFSASVMAAYKILPVSGSGEGAPVSVKFTLDQIQRPVDMKCRFVARQ